MPVDTVAPGIEFVFAVGPAYFVEIAKLRAARILWAQAVGAFGPQDDGACRMRLHVRTPRRNKSAYDRYTNLLRVTTEAFAAAVGGADQLTVEPFGFDAHLALNVQRILKEESHLDAVSDAGRRVVLHRVADGFAGAGGLGAVTDRRRPKAGMPGAGFRLDREGAGGDPCGAREGLFLPQAGPGGRQQLSQRGGKDAGIRGPPRRRPAGPLPQARLAEPFEKIRQRTNEHARQPELSEGAAAEARRRQDEGRARLTSASISSVARASTWWKPEEYLGTDADLIVLCSSDPEYLALAQEVCAAVKVPVLVAGNPKDQIEALQAAGVQGFIHIFSDIAQTLNEWQNKLGMRSANETGFHPRSTTGCGRKIQARRGRAWPTASGPSAR